MPQLLGLQHHHLGRVQLVYQHSHLLGETLMIPVLLENRTFSSLTAQQSISLSILWQETAQWSPSKVQLEVPEVLPNSQLVLLLLLESQSFRSTVVSTQVPLRTANLMDSEILPGKT